MFILKDGAFMDYSTVELQETIKSIVAKQYPEINKIILFGSYSRNDANCKSDLDLCISSTEKIKARVVYALISRLKEAFNKPIALFRKQDIDQQSDFYKNIESEGVVIYEKIIRNDKPLLKSLCHIVGV